MRVGGHLLRMPHAHDDTKRKPARRPAKTNAAGQGILAGSKHLVTDNNFHYMPRQRKWGRNENTRRRLRKGMGGGADAGACLGSLIGHEYHRMMTSEIGRCLSFRQGKALRKDVGCQLFRPRREARLLLQSR
ncbi:hypothetical protein EFB14_27225 [Rhizobium fabae]|uniref:Uncharacterized protein n=1 Tax=Rhizobium fabae TaxID=573179 RepID=A0ABY0B2K4_9HYPH|nr:hypothetical protein EFB14_27225 [Rhizobium fabae]